MEVVVPVPHVEAGGSSLSQLGARNRECDFVWAAGYVDVLEGDAVTVPPGHNGRLEYNRDSGLVCKIITERLSDEACD